MKPPFPFLTAYDPPGASEGSLDPMGLYAIADQLAIELVPAVRERMQRVRFLTAMAVGSIVTEGLEGDSSQRDASPYLVWEWLVVEAMVRTFSDENVLLGVPGTQVTRRALARHGYLDARSYLKSPRIFGFNGDYKRLAVHLGVVDVHLASGPQAALIADAWAQGVGLGSLKNAKPLLRRWSAAVERSLDASPPRTRAAWNAPGWAELAHAFLPEDARARERRVLRELLLRGDAGNVGALPSLWALQRECDDSDFSEEWLHGRLEADAPEHGHLVRAIRAYEAFGRSLQDAFDLFRAEAGQADAPAFVIADIARNEDFVRSVRGLDERFEAARRAVGETRLVGPSLAAALSERFGAFAEPMDPEACALTLCEHHEAVQRGKSAEGKRPWFDRLDRGRIYLRHGYRDGAPRGIQPGRYVHGYRGQPIRRFYRDLA